jgi:23S rRNA pseudouridine1911/1915/1917 synthase
VAKDYVILKLLLLFPGMQGMQEEKLTVVVPEELAGKRLDQALAVLCPQHSRARLQAWIKAGNVTVNREPSRQRTPVKAGEEITIFPVWDTHQEWSGEAIQLDILYEDDALIILNKPAGLVVHPGAGNPAHTLLNALLYHAPELDKVPRAGIFQRLDKDTSGIMVIARTPDAHTFLVDQLQQRHIIREYQAVVTGVMTSGGTVEAPIGRHPVHRKRMAVNNRGKAATTHYRILKKYPSHTHIRLKLESGRTHQIRVHMAHLHYPVVGDPVYGGRLRIPGNITPELKVMLQTFPRQALHACTLGLTHPRTGESLSWDAPLPGDIGKLLTALEHDSRQ